MTGRSLLAVAAVLGLLVLLAAEQPRSPYPATKTEPVVDQLHGESVADPYRWLEDGSHDDVKAWVEEQNALTEAHLARHPDRGRIRTRLSTLLDLGSITTPVPVGRKALFFGRREADQNQSVLHFREGLNGPDHILVDPNELSDEGQVAIDWWYPSRDGRLIAYGLSRASGQCTLHLRDVVGGRQLLDVIPHTPACSLAWLPNGKGFFYTRYPEPGSVPKGEERFHRRVYFHTVGDEMEKDELVFGAGRAAEDWPEVRLSPDGRWLVVVVRQGWTTTEVFLKDLSKADAAFIPLGKKTPAVANVVPRDDVFYVHTNEGAPRYRLFAVDPQQPERDNWREIVPESDDVLETVAVVGDTIVATVLHKASSRLRLFDRSGRPLGEVKLPTLGTIAGLGGEPDGNEVFFGFQSFASPPCVYRVDLRTQKAELWQRVRSDVDPERFEVEQIRYLSRDKTPVTMFLAYKKGLIRDGRTPTLLCGYGGFGLSQTPTFSASRLLFLEKGGLLAVANLRGGGEYGGEWHRAGMLERKQNAFDDFIAAAQWLIGGRYTDRDHLAIQGGSNGGLLVGVAITQHPDLFKAACCHVPLLDMVRYHKFLIARLWIPEYGCAENPEQFQWLYSYSPYHRVKPGVAYPAVLLTASESDPRVDPLHARKMTARLQAATSSNQPILLRLETQAGHGAGQTRAKVLQEQVDIWTFLFSQLGMKM